MVDKRVPELRFEGFDGDWEQRKLGEVFQQTVEYIDPKEAGLELWSVTVENGLTPKSERYNREFLVKKNDKFKAIHPDEIVYNPMNMTLGSIGFNNSGKDVAVSGYYVTMKLNEGFDTKYFATWLPSPNAINLYKLYATGSLIERQRVQFPTLSGIKTLMPSLNEQKQIGLFFKQLDTTTALHQQKLDQLKRLKQGFLQILFGNKEQAPKVRFAGFDEEWEQRKLIEVAKYRNGKAHEQNIEENGKYIVVNSKFVSTNGKVRKYSNTIIEPLKKNELAFVLSDVPNGKAIARTFLVDKEHIYSLNQRIAGITPHKDIDSYFLNILMNRNPYFLKFDNGVGQTNLTKADVENFAEKYPSYKEQKKIGTFFKQLDNTINLHQTKLEKLKQLKQAFLQSMFI
ncbi:restriction endonuclease subunit S [Enterococcus thailandicus]|uniref:restriction endonuclease subunit S n=1 Tax=Enterococcus thailandicus TaxID=417368 RepID=UPI003BEE602F